MLATHHIGFTVHSLERSLDFYVGLLGFEVRHRWQADAAYIGDIVGHPGVTLVVATLGLPGSDVGLELLEYVGPHRAVVDTDNANPGMSHLALVVDDLVAMHRELTEAGVRSVGSPLTHTTGPNTGGMVVYMIDPDGFRLELIQRP